MILTQVVRLRRVSVKSKNLRDFLFCRDFVAQAVLDQAGKVDDSDDDGVREKHLEVDGGEVDKVDVFWV